MATILDLMERERGWDRGYALALVEPRRRPARDADRQRREGRARGPAGRRDRVEVSAVAYEFKLPDLGEGLTEGEIARWLVVRGPGDRRGRPARRDPDRQDDGGDPVARGRHGLADPRRRGRGRPGRHRARRDRRRRALPSRRDRRPSGPRRAPRADGAKVRATPLVRRLAQELGVDLENVSGTGPGGRVTEADVRGGRRGRSRRPSEGRREPLRGVRRADRRAHGAGAREIPAVTWVEECDFARVDLGSSSPTVLKACRGVAARVPRAERAARGRRDRASSTATTSASRSDRAGPRRPGRARLRLALDRGDRRGGRAPRRGRARAARSGPRSCAARRSRVTSAGKLAGLFVTTPIEPPEVAILGVAPHRRAAGRPRRRDRRAPDRARLGHVRPPRRRRGARGRVRPRRDPPARRRRSPATPGSPRDDDVLAVAAARRAGARISPPGHLVEWTFAYAIACSHRGDELVERAGLDALRKRSDHVGSRRRSADRRRRGGAGTPASPRDRCRGRAQEHRDPAARPRAAEVDVRLLHGSLERLVRAASSRTTCRRWRSSH